MFSPVLGHYEYIFIFSVLNAGSSDEILMALQIAPFCIFYIIVDWHALVFTAVHETVKIFRSITAFGNEFQSVQRYKLVRIRKFKSIFQFLSDNS